MRRPCVIPKVNDGKPFCAYMSFVELDHNGEFWEVLIEIESSSYRYVYAIADTEKEANAIVRILEWQLAQALNPPIKVTQAVLDAMEKVPEAKFYVGDDESKYLLEWQGVWEYESKNDSWQNGRDFDDEGIPSHSKLQIGDYIQADCPLGLQVLLQFNVEGEVLDA